MDEVKGDGFAELQPNETIEGQFAYDNGDQSTLGRADGDCSTAC
jgi:hypothetical protein